MRQNRTKNNGERVAAAEKESTYLAQNAKKSARSGEFSLTTGAYAVFFVFQELFFDAFFKKSAIYEKFLSISY